MLLFQKYTDKSLLGVWKIDESIGELLSFLDNDSTIYSEILNLKAKSKIQEKLAVRVLLKHLLKKEVDILYHPSGKPYLKMHEKYISISHTKGYVAVILSSYAETGIDIQYITPKVEKVQPRFISPSEFIDPENELIHLLLHWAAKETLYKTIGIPGLSFKNDLFIFPFIPKEKGQFESSIHNIKKIKKYIISYFSTPQFVLTFI